MIRKLLVLLAILATFLNGASLTTSKTIYSPNENIVVNFANMTAKNKDWIGIYPIGSSNAWGNVKAWMWTTDRTNGQVILPRLAVGNYEVRAFYNNSYVSVAKKAFSVGTNTGGTASLTTSKSTYSPNENIVINFANMRAKNKDWIGIYPAGSSNAWGNVKSWKWTNDRTNGQVILPRLPAGNYEVRAFYNNSFLTVTRKAFRVGTNTGGGTASLTTSKATYTSNENIVVNFANMRAKNKDWIGIYPAGSSNAWGNVKSWKWTNDRTNGQVTLSRLPAGNYEVRAFYNNSFVTVARKFFTVKSTNQNNNQYAAITNLMLQAKRGTKQVTYIVAGDSTRFNAFNKMIPYYTSQLKKINVRLYNNSEGGQRAEYWVKNIRFGIINHALAQTQGQGENTILEYAFGLNDYDGGRTLASTKRWIKEGLQKYMTLKPKAKVFLASPVATGLVVRGQELRVMFGEIAKELNIPLVDTSLATRQFVGNPEYYHDAVHPNAKGSRLVVDYILRELSNTELRNALGI